ncbi:hypothetical protein HNQ40_000400 [Algisphaera agarilytica]|uniref:Uncharacterized protein n=1 Tax=Algisphaera agarilytica TaxID=1385975 RepID=A0A7X0LJB2_9BACT|nr:hypothetical protein [Algisphaera agarilytica]MBB6428594.1 hypothetical protein [Algisphaera agarilytica]
MLLASALLAVVVAGLSQTVVSGQAHTYNALHEERALALAEALMEEALALSYADQGGDTTFGPDTDENTRAVYDGLDDMHGYTEDAGTLADPAGVLYPETYQVFSRAVTVATDTATIAGLGGTIDGMTLTVTVAEAGGREWTITRFVPEPAE